MCKNRECPPGKYGVTITKEPRESHPYSVNIYYRTGLTGGYTIKTPWAGYRTKLGATIAAFKIVRKEEQNMKHPPTSKVVRRICL